MTGPIWFWGQFDALSAAISSANAAWLLIPISLVGTVATAWAAFAAARAARAAEHSTELAQDTAQKQLRAYIQIDQIQLFSGEGPAIAVGAKPKASIRLRNSGQTPAYEVSIRGVIALRSVPLVAGSFDVSLIEPESQAPLGAGGDTTSTVLAPGILSPETVTKLLKGEERIYVVGEIRYRDIFGRPHRTSFRLFNTPGRVDGAMRFDCKGNESN